MSSSYETTIADADAVRYELAQTSDHFLELLASEGNNPDAYARELAAAVREPGLAELYAVYLPLVMRFIRAELDAEAPSRRGMGRLADGERPRRLGARYRKQLRDPQAVSVLGAAIERTILAGFASHAAFCESPGARKPPEEVWGLWLRHLLTAYHSTNELLGRAQRGEESSEGLIAVMTMLLCDRGTAPLVEGFERFGLLRGGRLARWRSARAVTYMALFIGAGRMLFHVLTEDVDETFAIAWPVEVLEDYERPRKRRDLV